MITHLWRKWIQDLGDLLFQIVSKFVDSYCEVFLLKYEIYCSDVSPAYLVPLYLPTFVAIPRYPKIIFLRQKKAAWLWLGPSYDDGKQSFYSILSSPHWEMGCHQLSITTLHCISSEFTKMYFLISETLFLRF